MADDHAQAAARKWARTIAAAYAETATPEMESVMVSSLAEGLEDQLTTAIIIAVPADDWPDYVNGFLNDWEDAVQRFRGPRLLKVNEAAGTIEMGAPRSRRRP